MLLLQPHYFGPHLLCIHLPLILELAKLFHSLLKGHFRWENHCLAPLILAKASVNLSHCPLREILEWNFCPDWQNFAEEFCHLLFCLVPLLQSNSHLKKSKTLSEAAQSYLEAMNKFKLSLGIDGNANAYYQSSWTTQKCRCFSMDFLIGDPKKKG